MTTVGWLPAPADELFGTEATAEESYELLTVDVPPASWPAALQVARDQLSCTYFDWLSAVDEPGTGFRVSAHVVSLSPVRRLLLRTTVPHEAPTLASAVGVYAGAAWHERETHEMFGVVFEGHPALDHLLLPETFEGHPLRKDFVLAARVAKAWPGAKEPGESDHGGPKRRQMLPPGVPDPNEWGPLKGQLPPAPTRPTRAAGRPPTDRPTRPTGDRPVRRARSAAEGSASQPPTPPSSADTPAVPRRARSAAEGSASQAPTPVSADAPAAPRGARSAAEGSASQVATPASADAPAAPRRARSAMEGSASQVSSTAAEGAPADGQPGVSGAAAPRRTRSASEGSASQPPRTPSPQSPTTRPAPAPRSSDAPWHHARPAFDEPETRPEREPRLESGPARERGPVPEGGPAPE
ncbi:MAG: NADH-quinone oxidoreductase subunit C, partial [Streptomyces sp.]|nr:NADH-quinone oxidoreductase subunit C [Streptomyces sp.]